MQEKSNKGNGDAPIHVKVSSPGTARRDLLSLAIDFVKMQKKHREFLNRKKEKEDYMKKLRRNVAEIKELMRLLDSYELPMSLQDLESLPQFKRHKEALKKMEAVRLAAEEHINRYEHELESLATENVRPVPRAAREFERKQNEPPRVPKPTKAEQKKAEPKIEIPKKPVDKLETDLEDLQRRLESI